MFVYKLFRLNKFIWKYEYNAYFSDYSSFIKKKFVSTILTTSTIVTSMAKKSLDKLFKVNAIHEHVKIYTFIINWQFVFIIC